MEYHYSNHARVVFNNIVSPAVVVTLYRTNKPNRYWRPS